MKTSKPEFMIESEVRELLMIMDWACKHYGQEVGPMLVGDEPNLADIKSAGDVAVTMRKELREQV